MAERDEIVKFLNGLLQPQNYRDRCPNGLQVYGRKEVQRMTTCASVSHEFFRQSQEVGADMLLVHHGLFWDSFSLVIDPLLAQRLRILLDQEMNLIAYHLPLDAHSQYGNNAQLAQVMQLQNLDFNFGNYHGTPIGCFGNLSVPFSFKELVSHLSERVSSTLRVFDYGKQKVSRIGIVSGGAGDIPFLLEAKQTECEVYVTGAMFEQAVAIAQEAQINVVELGHYNSEKLGVVALGEIIKQHFGIDVINIDITNPV